jgi:isoleucyl-tRNA synthetase
MTEDIYQNLVVNFDKNAPMSIHLCDFPEVNEAHIDTELETSMDEVLKVVVFGRAARNTANIKSRQPIGNMYIKAAKQLDDYFMDIVKDELNVKAAEFKDDLSQFTAYSFKPQLKTVGPKYGKQLGGIKEYLANIDGNAAMAELKNNGALKFSVGDVEISLAEEDLLIDIAKMDGYVTEGDNYVTVVIDTTLTPELIEEGYVRELISKIQNMRKDSDFNVTDRIKVYVSGNDKIKEVMNKNADEIKRVVLGDEFVMDATCDNSKEWNINGEKVTIGVEVNDCAQPA